MSPALIQKNFEHLLRKGSEGCRQRRTIGMSANLAKWYRYQIVRNNIRLETQIRWLHAAGIDTGIQKSYSAADMIAFAKWARHPRHAEARKLGWQYLLEKWEASLR